ncbi:MAG TPA: ATP12 family protein [Xanthobacteraceae bacterium]|nr:ATP12 family protein [Xanthobacteraceae bacterium]
MRKIVIAVRDLFATIPLDDPVTAARRGGRAALRRRSYAATGTNPVDGGYAVVLDGKPVRTPAGRVLAMPALALARAIAAEWAAQRDVIDPATMPMTRLANAIIDGVAEKPGAVASEIEKYLASDLLFYRASGPQPLRERQEALWDPILAWARDALGANFVLAEGVVHVAQPDAALKAAAAAIPSDPWRLGALDVITTLTGSALIALALAQGPLTADAAWQAAHVDEDWNVAQWGKDEMAMQRRGFRFAEFSAAVAVLRQLQK